MGFFVLGYAQGTIRRLIGIASILFSQDGAVIGTVGYNGTARLQLLSQDRFRKWLGVSAGK